MKLTSADTQHRSAVSLRQVGHAWDEAGGDDLAIEGLEIGVGERWFVQGVSGSGKSTLLGILSGVLASQRGEVTVLGAPFHEMAGAARDHFRADHIGYIFQMFNLIPYLSVVENVTLPLRFSSRRKDRVCAPEDEALRLLGHLGMDGLSDRIVTTLSVGQQQRVAAARALIGSPEIILADEPTSALDEGHSESFVKLLFEECGRTGATLVFVSHDARLAGLFDQTLHLKRGAS